MMQSPRGELSNQFAGVRLLWRSRHSPTRSATLSSVTHEPPPPKHIIAPRRRAKARFTQHPAAYRRRRCCVRGSLRFFEQQSRLHQSSSGRADHLLTTFLFVLLLVVSVTGKVLYFVWSLTLFYRTGKQTYSLYFVSAFVLPFFFSFWSFFFEILVLFFIFLWRNSRSTYNCAVICKYFHNSRLKLGNSLVLNGLFAVSSIRACCICNLGEIFNYPRWCGLVFADFVVG